MPADFRDFSFLDLDADLDGGMHEQPQGRHQMGPENAGLARQALGIADQSSALGMGVRDSAAPIRMLVDISTASSPRVQIGGKLGLGPGHMSGIVTVQISVKNVNQPGPGAPAIETAARLIIDVEWGTGVGGGSASVDATRGAIFTVGGVTSIQLFGRLLRPSADLPILPILGSRHQTREVQAVCLWNGAASPKQAFYTPPYVDLVAGVESDPIPIPDQGIGFLALAREPLLLPALEARFYYTSAAGASAYTTLNPNANGTPIVGGVQYVRLFSPADMHVVPTFELNL